MGTFELARESDEKLWVKTPLAVTRNVWDYFVRDVFPDFDLSRYDMKERSNHLGRYINMRHDDYAELADGQILYYTHARLPYDARQGLAQAEWGLVHVPDGQKIYLDTLQERLSTKDEPANLFEYFNFLEKDYVKQAFRCYEKNVSHHGYLFLNEFGKRITEDFIRSFAFRDPSTTLRHSLTSTGRTNLYGEDDRLECRTAADFLDRVRALLKPLPRSDVLERTDFTNISSNLYSQYKHLLA